MNNFIFGPNGSGKTKELLNGMVKDGENLFITADPAVTFVEGYMAKHAIPGKVVGINSLPKFITSEIGGRKVMSREEQLMLLQKIVSEEELDVLSADGIPSLLYDLFNEAEKEGINCSGLDAPKSFVELNSKIADIRKVYDRFKEWLGSHGMATAQEIYLRGDAIDAFKRFKKITVDSLAEYSWGVKKLLKEIIDAPCEATICFISTTADDKEIFGDCYSVGQELFSYAKASGKKVTSKALQPSPSTDGISLIRRDFFKDEVDPDGPKDGVVLHSASTAAREVEWVVHEVKALLSNYAATDINIAANGSYVDLLMSTFAKEGVNAFYYKNATLSEDRLFQYLMKVLDIVTSGADGEKLTAISQLPFAGVDASRQTAITRFFKRFGGNIDVAFKNGSKYDPQDFAVVKETADVLLGNITLLKDTVKEKTVRGYVAAVAAYFNGVGVAERLAQQANLLRTQGAAIDADTIEAGWNALMTLMKSAHMIFADTEMEWIDFQNILKSAAENWALVSSSTYHSYVSIKSPEKVSSDKSKVLFLMGCTEGTFPHKKGEMLISDMERFVLAKKGFKFEPAEKKRAKSIASAYAAMTIPSEKLYVSWPMYSEDGELLSRSSILDNIVEAFEVDEEKEGGYDKDAMFADLIADLRNYKDTGVAAPDLNERYQEFAVEPRYAKRLFMAAGMITSDKGVIKAAQSGLKKDEKFYSITRIENFHKCPFKHFLDYSIRPKTEKQFEETAAERGTLFHAVMRAFFDKVVNGTANTSDRDSVYNEVANIFDTLVEEHNENVLLSSDEGVYATAGMKNRISASVWNAVKHLKAGEFSVARNEYAVGKDVNLSIPLSDGSTAYLVGVIDRVDTVELNGEKYARVLDYKTGAVKWSPEKLNAGVQLQLPLYLKAISGEAKAGGMYYFRLAEPVADIDEQTSEEELYKMSGVTIDDIALCVASDGALDEAGSASKIIPVSLTAKGAFTKRSKVVNEEEMDTLFAKAEEKAAEAIMGIKNGESKAYPYKGEGENPCEFCSYKAICQFDARKSAVRK